MKALTAGSEIDAWCTKCKMDLGHRIVALVEGVPKRVVCQTCDSTHNYRAPKSAGKTAVKRASKASDGPKPKRETAAGKAEAERIKDWEQKVAGAAETAFRRYAIDMTFVEGELVLHRKFGEGYVVEVDDEGKVYIMFRDQLRTLVHGRT
ncbi:MAG: hypothetical protein H6718_36445 [Polyangiaceae bacterium]|nr:hypothetical protein [Myxococcales bacterium]MCB9590952.1 hypothetical protein [Polyangiaceae bacterium]MCB9605148.1 hypothetical protein [Polyangiaceae bacterium]